MYVYLCVCVARGRTVTMEFNSARWRCTVVWVRIAVYMIGDGVGVNDDEIIRKTNRRILNNE